MALVVILALLVFMAYRTFNERLQAARNADTATALIEDADVIVVQVDTVVRSEVTSGLAEQARIAGAQVPEATRQLQQAIALLEASSQGTTLDDEQRSAELLDAAKARLDMMEQAPTILRLNQASSEALVPAREGWDGLIAADRKSDEAVAEYNRLTKAGVQRSRTLNKEVAGELVAAREKLALAEQLFPEGPFEEYLGYIDLRISLNRLSQQADAAWLAGKREKGQLGHHEPERAGGVGHRTREGASRDTREGDRRRLRGRCPAGDRRLLPGEGRRDRRRQAASVAATPQRRGRIFAQPAATLPRSRCRGRRARVRRAR